MLESTIEFLSTVPWYWVLLAALVATMVENLFPPAPGDSVIVFTGTLVAFGTVGFFPLLIVSTIGSILGFAIMFILGAKFEHSVIESGKFKFISRKLLAKVERWFQRYGYGLIVINRFIAGTRAVIAFFAGMSGLNFSITIALSAVSALLWNSVLIFLGFKFGENWEIIDHYLDLYGKIVAPIAAAILLFFIIRWIIKMNGNNGKPKEIES